MPQGSQLAALKAFIVNLRAHLVKVTTGIEVVLTTGGAVPMSDQACAPLGTVASCLPPFALQKVLLDKARRGWSVIYALKQIACGDQVMNCALALSNAPPWPGKGGNHKRLHLVRLFLHPTARGFAGTRRVQSAAAARNSLNPYLRSTLRGVLGGEPIICALPRRVTSSSP